MDGEMSGARRQMSLSVMEADDRTLIHCHAGCTTKAICALGITLADLLDGSRQRLDPLALRHRRAAYGLQSWRQSEIQRCAEELRTRNVPEGAPPAGPGWSGDTNRIR
jgi:hypothetical protein